ncbi:MAG: NAD(P)/FAD-dependent oxidoreductase [Clostridia bacterium]|nr:NAD(P)/FAD-dependent oxidoreductase [Clostridia bacterium]
MSNNIIIVGGGAAGLIAAGTAAQQGCNVTIIERNDRVGRKIMITGKGRCNVTNACTNINELIDAVPVNGRFLYSAFSHFMPTDTINFFEQLGVPIKLERGNRVFPVSDKAVDIVDALDKFIKQNHVKRIKGRVTKLIVDNDDVVGVKTQDGKELFASSVIIATGGVSYPLTGSTGDGYELAKQAGHTIIDLKPSLVPLESSSQICKDLQGLSLKNIEIKVFDTEKRKEIYSDFGEMLFTHFGVSGPLILSASSHMNEMKQGKYELLIDLKPALSHEKLDARIQRDFLNNSNKDFANSLDALLPQKMIPVIVELSGIRPTLKINQITRDMRRELVNLIKELKVPISDFRPIKEAIVTSGGVKTSEINPKTMQSKLMPSLYFAGEVIDVDAYTGGYNLQIAFSTGYLAGKSVSEECL